MKINSSKNIFLTAKWKNLILINYAVRPDLMKNYVPDGFLPDTFNNYAYLSLVAFDFLDTKVKGIKFPFHINFPEINLRFYIKNKKRRGVIFIREFVPKIFIQYIANIFYNENYLAIPMSSNTHISDTINITHKIKFSGKFYEINAEAEKNSFLPHENSLEHFLKEHKWGFVKNKNSSVSVYEVYHPAWNVYKVKNFQTDFNFKSIYGKEFAFLNDITPQSVFLAEGSEIKVFIASEINPDELF